jgi:ribose 5-phosphate isomerase B
MRVAIAYNGTGYALAQAIKSLLHQLKYPILDCGSKSSQADMVDLSYCTGQEILAHHADRAILICPAGLCTCITVNKMKGLYAAPCYDRFEARISRHKYNTNVLCLSNLWTDTKTSIDIVKEWLETSFSKRPCDVRSLSKIQMIEAEQQLSSSSEKTIPNKVVYAEK